MVQPPVTLDAAYGKSCCAKVSDPAHSQQVCSYHP